MFNSTISKLLKIESVRTEHQSQLAVRKGVKFDNHPVMNELRIGSFITWRLFKVITCPFIIANSRKPEKAH